MPEIVDGVDVYELIIPSVCFAICIGFQCWEFVGSHNDRARARVLFSKVRSGWVLNNYMKGTVAVNTTRDYIKSAVFFANSSITLATFTVGYAGSRYTDCVDDDCKVQDWLLIVKLGVLAIVLLCIFFVFTQCTRFAVHFSFCINTEELEGVLIPKSLLEKLFNHTYKYYSLGIRLYFGTIPVFAWIFHAWVLVMVTPFYLVMVRGLETADFVQADLEEIEMLRQAAELPPMTAAAAAGPAAVAPGEEEEESVVVVPQADKRL